MCVLFVSRFTLVLCFGGDEKKRGSSSARVGEERENAAAPFKACLEEEGEESLVAGCANARRKTCVSE